MIDENDTHESGNILRKRTGELYHRKSPKETGENDDQKSKLFTTIRIKVRVKRIGSAPPTLEPVLPASIMMLYTGTSTEADDHDDPPASRQKGKKRRQFGKPV